ncbi:Phosphomevalonate kinase [Wallemia mellicola]|uniref:Phosphomevalonate kinase n=1 Tax=Wallemia mellicola TaxID=1708541 RepID=A0AB74KCW7_9BASI|nr:hypothetical protein E3Q24_03480 [Wallemia mellicola]TIB80795.1 Phosphomevalonate kinase [Wallemia mellicola]TIB84858.1 Phosphomevalonate kinase [Wallemia mellicola]TIC02064.1 Phosphomevalonate kinase [Wallemia mellicola]TIC09459.1 Phosphomevalonate kinase [Wallemia mellicola]
MISVSAPGKVLLAGGYLVLDPAYSGVVVSTDARFYSLVKPTNGTTTIVNSPQFGSSWEYNSAMEQLNDGPINDFVQLALTEVSKLISKRGITPKGLSITISGDNDFYSQRAYLNSCNLDATVENLKKVPKLNSDLKQISKTGLGSSAALITSLVGALLAFYGLISRDINQNDLKLVHNLAQYIHCRAQGKVGSGFDVSAATFGSQVYSRFDPEIIKDVMDSPTTGEIVDAVISKEWDNNVEKVGLPYGISIQLADIEHGSHTPSLVKKVHAWKAAKPDEVTNRISQAKELYAALNNSNQGLVKVLKALNESHKTKREAYEHALDTLSTLIPQKWQENIPANDVIAQFDELRMVLKSIRKLFRELSDKAGVPIEPEEQTRLLDACSKIEGVIGGGVPGAGGYDAIYILTISRMANQSHAQTQVHKTWLEWTELSVSPLVCGEGFEGLRLENAEEISRAMGIE